MPEFRPDDLAGITGGSWHVGEPLALTGFHFDTRRIEAGNCFIALSSEQRDGHDFVADAIVKGASCALTNRVLDCGLPQLVVADTLSAMGAIAADVRSKFSKPVVAITGSCGKTSTKEMLRLLLGQPSSHATPGNWNNRIGVPMTLFGLESSRHDFAVIEAGINQPGEMALLGAMIEADLTVLTNIGPAHLELLGSLAGVAAEKSKLCATAKADSPVVLPAAVLQYPAFAPLAKRCIAVCFDGDRRPTGVRSCVDCTFAPAGDGQSWEFSLQGRTYRINCASLGVAQNAALAIVAAQLLGVGHSDLAHRLRMWAPGGTRGRAISTDEHYYYIDCYNANPASMVDALQAFQRSAPAQMSRCYIIGAMNELGAGAAAFHLSVGERLALRPEDSVVFVGPELLTAAYREGALRSGALPGQIKCAGKAASIQSMVADFKGALFLKGSRVHQLEELLAPSLV